MTTDTGGSGNGGFSGQLEALAREALRLRAAVETANWLPPDFPKDDVLRICDMLALSRDGTPEGVLPALLYARHKLSEVRRHHVELEEPEVGPEDEPSLVREDALDDRLKSVIADISTVIADYPPPRVESAEASEHGDHVPVPGDPTSAARRDIARDTRAVEDRLADGGENLARHEAEVPDAGKAAYRDLQQRYVDSRIITAFLNIEILSRRARRAWLDRLGRAFSRIPGVLKQAFDKVGPTVQAGLRIHDVLHKLEHEAVHQLGRAIVAISNEIRKLMFPEPRPGAGPGPASDRPSVFHDVDEPWCPEMMALPTGRFLMGTPDKGSDEDKALFLHLGGTEETWNGLNDGDGEERPCREVRIGRHFTIGRYPVTFAEFDAYCQATGSNRLMTEAGAATASP